MSVRQGTTLTPGVPEPTAPSAPPRPRAARVGGHLDQVDAFRLVSFTAVIAVHSLNAVVVEAGVGGTAAQALLLTTRKAFFALLAFVAARSWVRRRTTVRAFWRRRLPLVVMPLAAWTLVYGWGTVTAQGGVLPGVRRYVGMVLTGDSSYHMYFLVASIQAYVLLPFLLRWLDRVRAWHGVLLAVALVVQVVQHVVIEYVPVTDGLLGWYRANCGELAITYQFWVLLGLVAGLHLERLQPVVDRWAGALVALGVGAGVLAVLFVRTMVAAGYLPAKVASTFSPFLVPWYVAAIVGLYALASAYAGWVDRTGRRLRIVGVGAQASFGVYLMHPLLLPFVGPRVDALLPGLPPAVWVLLVTGLLAGLSTAAVTLLRRTPLSVVLTGRPWLRRQPDGT